MANMAAGRQLPKDKVVYPICNELDLRRTAPYLGGIESELLSLNKIARSYT